MGGPGGHGGWSRRASWDRRGQRAPAWSGLRISQNKKEAMSCSFPGPVSRFWISGDVTCLVVNEITWNYNFQDGNWDWTAKNCCPELCNSCESFQGHQSSAFSSLNALNNCRSWTCAAQLTNGKISWDLQNSDSADVLATDSAAQKLSGCLGIDDQRHQPIDPCEFFQFLEAVAMHSVKKVLGGLTFCSAAIGTTIHSD